MQNRGHALARDELIRVLTAYKGVATEDGAGDFTTLVDSNLIGRNDFLTGKSILIMSGDAQDETTGISSFDDTTGEITFATPLSAQIVAGTLFRVLNTLPESLHITSGIVQIEGYDYVSGEPRLVAVNESGQIEIRATVADIVTAKISGQVVQISGQVVQTSGQSIAISGQPVKVSGQTVQLTSGTGPVGISGQTITQASGAVVIAKVSGQTVVVQSGSVVLVSGQVVKLASGTGPVGISGQTITQASGATVISKISGQTITQASGAVVLVSGQTVVVQSGSVVLVSGQVVKLASGTGPVGISGQTITQASGATVIAKVSGQTVVIQSGLGVVVSGQTVQLASGAGPVGISGQSVVVTSGQVVAKISGQSVVVTSGQVVAKISGQSVVVTSGQVVAKVSGQVVKVSGQIVDIRTPTAILTGAIKPITDASGGVELATGAVKAAQVKALGTNSGVILIGSSGQRPWYEATCSGLGFVLDPGEAKSEDIDNFNKIYLVAQVSGDQVSYLGVN